MRTWVVVGVLSLTLLAGCIEEPAPEVDPEPSPPPPPDVVIEQHVTRLPRLAVDDAPVVEITGPAFVAIPLQAFDAFRVGPATWTLNGDGPEFALMLPTEPGALLPTDNSTLPCGPAPSSLLTWDSTYARQNLDRAWPEVAPGMYSLYVWVASGTIAIGFNGADPSADAPANATLIDATVAYNVTAHTLPVVITQPAPLTASAEWSADHTGQALILGRFSVEMQGGGPDRRSEGHLVQEDTECASDAYANPQRPVFPVLGVTVSGYTNPGPVTWNAMSYTDAGNGATVRIARLLVLEAAHDVVRPFWL